ncbi:aldehyde dehydrogenase [Streptomyces albipurpureus]|uniref:Aldehyde dehydrogenase n=1 Tax=Streptomyces albipurpureus TaxID=2897419 RepID=A0ABT0UPS6_9ACTN|nr:aldehyde dehydrogenase [Streptomyces sp. CWNU-1]MCM2390622.1 aldehyde dehydrogenase [Streptomyces sp. CWNU-1]
MADHGSTSADIIVAGQQRPGRGPTLPSLNPATGRVAAQVTTASVEDVDEAVAGGEAAMRDPAWRDLLPHERARLLHRAGQLLQEESESIARLQTQDNGKPITETRALVASAAGTFRYVAAALETLDEALPTARGPYLSMSVYEPIGPVAAITPWNSPIASEAQKAAPALAAGNAVLIKPAEWSPLAALRLGEVLLRAGIPPGLVSVLPGSGPVVGEALVRHPGIRKVSFTGGTTTGRRIGAIAAEKMMPVSLELGGKSPTIVLPDADLDLAVRGVLFGIFSSQGQACVAGSRLFVHRSVHDEFVARIVEAAERLVIGDPTAEGTHMGPLISDSHRTKVESYVHLAADEGGRIRTGGGRPSGGALSDGYYYLPTVITGLDPASRVCQEEIFGPVLVALPYDDEAELTALANATPYGLACGIWSRDYRRAWRLARRVEAGTVWINTYKQLSVATPFGGVKDSGLGREKGREGIRAFMSQKGIYWGLDETPLPWGD